MADGVEDDIRRRDEASGGLSEAAADRRTLLAILDAERMDHEETREALDAARSGPASGGGLDVRRVKQAVVNVAARHGAKSNQPMTVEQMAVGKMFGYSAATPDMDAEIAIEYDRLAATEPTDE
jgi:hypothetical protein